MTARRVGGVSGLETNAIMLISNNFHDVSVWHYALRVPLLPASERQSNQEIWNIPFALEPSNRSAIVKGGQITDRLTDRPTDRPTVCPFSLGGGGGGGGGGGF